MRKKELPKSAQVVVVGGGVIGSSVAYHLAQLGWKDVVLLERDRLTSGTTWHAAGLMVTFGSTSTTMTEMRKYTRELYGRIEEETEQASGFKPVGFIEVATDRDRLEEYRRVSALNRYCGIDVCEISPKEIQDLWPLARTDDILAGFYVKEDGRVNPVDATMALSRGARLRGARIFEECPATGVLKKNGRVTGVTTPRGNIQCEVVVNCAGMWARQFGALAGVNVPNQAAEHYYLITSDMQDLAPEVPVLEDPSCHAYYRPEMGGLMIGLFEPVCAPWKVGQIPEDFSFGKIPPDWERMTPYLEKAMSRVPRSLDTGIKEFFCGPESFTADLQPIVGEAPELKNYFVAAGLNSIGIIIGGGLGRLVAHWIVNGTPDQDVTAFHIDRLHPHQNNPRYRATRTVESLGLVYRHHYPTRSPETARDAKKSPFHDRLKARGAYFKDVSGWEGADWYAPGGAPARVDKLSWQRMNWFPYWEAEHRACRENLALIDMSFMSRFLVQGRDAGRVLDRISANNVNQQCGRITYTQWLNQKGLLEADLTVAKLEEEKFLVVVTDTMHRHAETWMRRNTPEDAHALVTDVTSGFGQLSIQGPRSREFLQTLTSADLSDQAFPFRAAREIDIGFARVLGIRITYVGELGYELYIPAEFATHVYDLLVEAGKQFDLQHAGLRALGSLRLEKAYRDYGHDMDNTDNPYQAGLGRFVKLEKPQGFIGQEAARRFKQAGIPRRRLVQVLVKDPNPLLYHAEILYRDQEPLGEIRSGSYGHTLGGAVGLSMIEAPKPVTQKFVETGEWEIDIANKRYPARVSIQPLYDPKMERIKA